MYIYNTYTYCAFIRFYTYIYIPPSGYISLIEVGFVFQLRKNKTEAMHSIGKILVRPFGGGKTDRLAKKADGGEMVLGGLKMAG